MARVRALACVMAFLGVMAGRTTAGAAATVDASRGILIKGTVVTMDDAGTVLPHGNVLVRGDQIVGVWGQGAPPPSGVAIGGARVVDLGPNGLVFPGLINVHDHPSFDVLPLWLPPASHRQPDQGRPTGTEPYANRYQWNGANGPPEYQRLVTNPLTALEALNLYPEALKYAETEALLGGETAIQGATDQNVEHLLVREVEDGSFGGRIASPEVPSIDSPTFLATYQATVQQKMRAGAVDAWFVHLAEGVPDATRRPGDTFSSRAEFDHLRSLGLLTDMTAIIHGTALTHTDFVAMRNAPTIRSDGAGDGLGAKLVWSPLSNLLLYGQTTNVYDALRAHVLVSLGTDWHPSGSPTLLGELKIADRALRDPRILGASRSLVPEVSISGKRGTAKQRAERALDELLVRMVTTNPAKTLRWNTHVGSIEAGKTADLMMITKPAQGPPGGIPDSPYRQLIDAGERDVHLVMVGGEPLAGDVKLMNELKPGNSEVVSSACGGYSKAIDFTKPGVPGGDETFATIRSKLENGLAALGGDLPPSSGGLSGPTNTYHTLKASFPGAAALSDADFRTQMLEPQFGTVNGSINLERIQLTPLFETDDHLLTHVLTGHTNKKTGVVADRAPPYKLYPANLAHLPSLPPPAGACRS
jgi:5-methylthioadenosine/S-adenosylhomocysteine deaminase